MIEYYLKKSRNKDAILSVSILQRIGRGTECQRTKTMQLETLDAVNAMLLRREITEKQALCMAKSEIERLRADHPPKMITATINQEIAKRYYDKAFKHKPNRRPKSAHNRIMHAARALGDALLPIATAEEIMQAVAKNVKNNSSRRSVISTTKSMLRFIGRNDVYLHKPMKKRPAISHLTLAELKRVMPFIPENLRNLYWTAFGTGCRMAECFGISHYVAENKSIFVESTVDRELEDNPTKTGEVRWVPVIKEAVPYVQAWIDTPVEFKNSIRRLRFAHILSQACNKAGIKPIVFRDLRHCYAIYLLQKRIPIELVARALGNSIAVCQAYYIGFILFKPELELFKKI